MKLVAEVVDDKQIEHEIATIERADGISPATVGLTIAEGKRLLESLRKEIVTAQVQQHGVNIRSCPACGSTFRTKGYYRSGASFCLRKGWHVYPAAEGMSLLGIANAHLLHAVHKQEPDHARVAVSHRQDGCAVAVWKGGGLSRRAPTAVCSCYSRDRAQPNDEGGETTAKVGGSVGYRFIEQAV